MAANLELVTTEIPAIVRRALSHRATIVAGEPLKAEIGSGDELDTEVPAGKSWVVTMAITVDETDA